MNKKILLLVLSAFFIIPNFLLANSPDDIIGKWYTKDDKSIVSIYKCGSRYCGKIIWLKEPKYKADDRDAGQVKRDRNNPNASKKNDPILGLNLLWGFDFEDGVWENGRIYDPENGKTYKCIIRLNGNLLKVRGYIGFSLLGRTAVWRRAG